MYRRLMASKRIILGLMLMLLSLPSGFAAEVEYDLSKKVYARTTYGIIRSINLPAREAIISGFKYEFGAVQHGWTAEVKMYGSEHGAYELLKPGMKVYVTYGELGFTRVVMSLQQLADDLLIPES